MRETDAAYADVTDRLYRDYRDLRERLLAFLVDSADGPKLALADAIQPAQKILDRVLFIAFAQRRDLMRGNLLESALKAHNEWHPQPVWSNFLGLFRYVDKGNHDMDIPPYNGGLFAEDPVVDALMLPEDLAKDVAALGAWDYRREVPVTVLGHIFEQSITDIERKKGEAARRGAAEGLRAQANRRRLHARHGHALSCRADRRPHTRRATRRSYARRTGSGRATCPPTRRSLIGARGSTFSET